MQHWLWDVSIGYFPKPRVYGVLETIQMLHTRQGQSLRRLCNILSGYRRAEAWAMTGLDYGAHSAAHLSSAIVYALYPVARLPISCVSVVLWVVA